MYIRPFAYKLSALIGVAAADSDSYSITVVPFGHYFTGKAGATAAVSSWRRVEDCAIPGRAKIRGAYVNSVLALDEVRRNGHDEAIFFNRSGMSQKGQLVTPPCSDDILEGITRASVLQMPLR